MHDCPKLRRGPAANIADIACLGLLLACLASPRAVAEEASALTGAKGSLSATEGAPSASPAGTAFTMTRSTRRAVFSGEPASKDARRVADWVVDSGDNGSLPFVIVDKTDAKVFVFDNQGRLQGAAPALLGLARGDDSVPGIGDRELSRIRPEERTTPAGRFVAALGSDLDEQDILWVDYADAISLHRVITTSPKERRLQRLATPSVLDNRISYGCINVPAKFYDAFVKPAFTGTNGVVYILPETKPIGEVFPFYEVNEPTEVAAPGLH